MTIETISVTANAAHVTAALQAVSDEKARYYLCGVFFDARGYIVATNGHILFAAKCADAGKLADVRPSYGSATTAAGVIVPTDAIKQAIKAAGRAKPANLELTRDTLGQWWITYGTARVAFTPIDGTFPDWTRVIPEAPETLTVAHYQPQYIAALGAMATALRDGKKDAAATFILHQNGDNPALVTFNRKVENRDDVRAPRGDCLAVIMPYRTHADDYARDGFKAAFLPAAEPMIDDDAAA